MVSNFLLRLTLALGHTCAVYALSSLFDYVWLNNAWVWVLTRIRDSVSSFHSHVVVIEVTHRLSHDNTAMTKIYHIQEEYLIKF